MRAALDRDPVNAEAYRELAKSYVQAGKLVHLLPEADVDGPPVHAIISLGQKMAAKTRAVVNHLAEALQKSGE